MEQNKRSFQGIWIPAEVWLSKDLTLQEKVFLVEIKSLSNSNGCYANNKYFADFFGLSKTRVSLVIKSLIEKGFIKSHLIYKGNTKQVEKRILTPLQKLNTPFNKSYTPPLTKVKYPPLEKLKDNNTVNNTINNNKNSMLVVSEETPKSPFDKFSNEAKVLFREVNTLFIERYRPKTQVQFVKQLKVIEKCLTMYSANDLIGLIKYAVNDETFWKRNLQSLNGLINKNKDGVLKIDSIYPNYAQEKSSAKKEFKNKITIKRGK